jgi:hypothetical protein
MDDGVTFHGGRGLSGWLFLYIPIPSLRTECSPITINLMDFPIFIMEIGYNPLPQQYLNIDSMYAEEHIHINVIL